MKQTSFSKTRAVRTSKRGQRRREGSTIVIVMLAMTVLLGFCAFATDYGMLTVNANQMQRACDAASLAGASHLWLSPTTATVGNGNNATTISVASQADRDAAIAEARKVAVQNGVPDDANLVVTITDADGNAATPADADTRCVVTAGRDQRFFFGRALGMSSSRVTRSATAAVQPLGAMGTGDGRVAPIGIGTDTYSLYRNDYQQSLRTGTPVVRDIILARQSDTVFGHVGSGNNTEDRAIIFDLRQNNGKAGPKFEDQLTGAENDPTSIMPSGGSCASNPTACATSLNANLNSEGPKFEDALGVLATRSANSPWDDTRVTDTHKPWTTDGSLAMSILNGISPLDASGAPNPRIINLIVTPPVAIPQNGTFDTPIVGYAPIYLQNVVETQEGKQTVYHMRVVFLPSDNMTGGSFSPAPAGSGITGARVVSLTG